MVESQLQRIKNQWRAEIDLLIGNNVKHAKALLEQIQQDLLEQIRPHVFNEGSVESVLHKREESFVRLCLELEKKGIKSPEDLSTYKYYKAVELIKEEADRQLKKAHTHGFN
jgi:hypothetical protein